MLYFRDICSGRAPRRGLRPSRKAPRRESPTGRRGATLSARGAAGSGPAWTACAVAGLALLLAAPAGRAQSAQTERLEVGLTASGAVIGALRIAAGTPDAPAVLVVGGLDGAGAAGDAIRAAAEAYAAAPAAERRFELVAIAEANPDAETLAFPPTGAAYREQPVAHALWRFVGLRAPDLVLVAGADAAGLADALATEAVAGVAPIPARRVTAGPGLLDAVPAELPPSPARAAIEARLARSPSAFATALGTIYGQDFDPPIYIAGTALIAHVRLGHVAHVERLVAPYVDGTRDSFASPFGLSSLVLAGHLVFAELAEQTGDPRYLERARAAADFAFTDDGRMRDAMPEHGEMSDSIFMGAAILAEVGALTGERRYFDMAARHIEFMNGHVRRADGLYRHSPLTDAAWGRGNGFAAIGYALTLSALPQDHPARERLLAEYRSLMAALARRQNADGTWRQVVDHPGAYHETSSTAIIGFSMLRGVRRGWLEADPYAGRVERAWRAVLRRTSLDGELVDVSESTNKQPTLEDYLMREALLAPDPRAGAFAMLFATELAAAEPAE